MQEVWRINGKNLSSKRRKADPFVKWHKITDWLKQNDLCFYGRFIITMKFIDELEIFIRATC